MARALEEAIRSGQWQVGSKLPGERVLASDYGVSRVVAREVLRSLESEGLIKIVPARGAFVSRPDGNLLSGAFSRLILTQGATVRDVAETRTVLEVEIAGRVAANHSNQAIEVLYANAESVDAGDDRVRQGIADLQFHSLLAFLAGNPVLTSMHRALAPHILLMMLRSERKEDSANVPHRAIVDSIRDQDVDQARELARAHVAVTERHFGADYERPVEEVASENLNRMSSGLWNLADVERVAFRELEQILQQVERYS